ncbi:SAM-dependent methyltransferase [Rhodanobacter sp. ANJX3]|uniref:class I SAM-dependent methyltransferase n=1 Tax=Rhodanobacter sp. ANJX3 TaxID=2723083 RepID=UPI0016168636|nr:class I SAM-dependent methyltransferase [Rhodanobacter sp. ANJX3]MBB5360246.1 SAM-dependent methyltransferase [Rhodanobacter sp. ANJX3]
MEPAAYIEMAEIQSRHWWFTGRRAILTSTIRQLRLPSNARILEIGCGTGGNLDMLATFGEVSAFDMEESARVLADKKTGGTHDIRAGHCPDNIPFQGERFDLICLFDVLEHIEQDTQTLAAIRSLLADNGRILVTIPAYAWLYGVHDKFLHHHRRYSAREIRQRVHATGYRLVRLSHFNTLLFPLAAIVRVKERLLGSKVAAGSRVPPEPINGLLRTIFAAERTWLKHFDLPFGVSLLCVLEKA